MARILVVDDEKETVGLVHFILERDGHTVVPFYDGQTLLDRVHSEQPDLIVLDIMMPGMDGYTVCTRLAADEQVRGVPILILTAKGDMRDVFQWSGNIASYMQKPFNPSVLRAQVKKILAERAGGQT